MFDPILTRVLGPILVICVCAVPSPGQRERPHVVLIMADDMGYTDIGCYGSEIRTPHLDSMAAAGVRFSQFYNTSRCCPTRASLLTGLYSHQAGIGLMTGDRGVPAYRGNLNRRCVTIAEALGEAGYWSAMSGKWHVTRHIGPDGPKDEWPRQRGFDRFYGTIIGAGSFWDPTTLCRDNLYITPENDPEYQPERFYYTDAISDNAVEFIEEHADAHADRPMFLYVAYTSAHWPMHAPEEDVEPYDGVYDEGFGPIRQRRLERARELGVLDADWEMSPATDRWERNRHQEWDIRSMEVYAAMVEIMDRGIGRILAALDRHGMRDDTVVMYLQDNGGCAEPFGRRSNEAQRAKFEVQFRPFGEGDLQPKIWPPMQTRDGRFVATGPGVMAGPEDTYVAYGRGWANTSNTPFRGFKHDPYEGGISTPFIVQWPNGIAAEQHGRVVDDPAHLIDVLPTLLAVAAARYPTEYDGRDVQPLEGVSLVSAWSGEPVQRAAPLCFEHHGNLALRDGRWKIVSMFRRNKPRAWELYDMVADRTELVDLADQQPERVARMVASWQAWADRVGVEPWPFRKR